MLTQLVKEQGYGLPAAGSVDEAVAAGGVEMFRGVRPHAGATSADQIAAMRDAPDFVYGSGVYGNGIYFSADERVAAGFAVKDPDAKGAGTPDGRTVRVALHPDAKVIDYEDLLAERAAWRKEDHGVDAYTRDEMLGDEGRFAAARGYDAIRIRNKQDGHWHVGKNAAGRTLKTRSRAAQYVVLNRGALTMEAS